MDGSSQLAQFQAAVAAKHADFESRKRARITADDNNDTDNSRKAFYREFKKVVELADVIIQVLDARDPLSCRCPDVERYIRATNPNKRIILLLNKIDLVPREVGEQWLRYLREELPTVAFKCSTQQQDRGLAQRHAPGINQAGRQRGRLHASKSNGNNNNNNNNNNGNNNSNNNKSSNGANNGPVSASSSANAILNSSSCLGAETLLALLKNYTRHGAEGGGPALKAGITVGVVGLPNVGKSSLINSLKRARVAQVGNTPGVTKAVQEVVLDKHIKLLDSPGVVFASSASDGADAAAIALRNSVKVERLADPITPVGEILKRVAPEKLAAIYKLKEPLNISGSTPDEEVDMVRDGGDATMGGDDNVTDANGISKSAGSRGDSESSSPSLAVVCADRFLQLVALARGKLRRGGTPDVTAAARVVLQDWNDGRIPYFTLPPQRESAGAFAGEAAVVAGWAKEFDVDKVFQQEKEAVFAHIPSMAAVEMEVATMAPHQTLMGGGAGGTVMVGAPSAQFIPYQSAGTVKVDLRDETSFGAAAAAAEIKKKNPVDDGYNDNVDDEEDDEEEEDMDDDEVAMLNAAVAAARRQAKLKAIADAEEREDDEEEKGKEKEKDARNNKSTVNGNKNGGRRTNNGGGKGANNGAKGGNVGRGRNGNGNSNGNSNSISNGRAEAGAENGGAAGGNNANGRGGANASVSLGAGARTQALMRSAAQMGAAQKTGLYAEDGQFNPHAARAQRKKAKRDHRPSLN